jgi:general stress protein 26
MNTQSKVFELLKRNLTVSLASITRNGYPRPIPMKVISVDEENNVWFATSLKSDKVAEFAENPRAGIACNNEEMSVSLQGKISIVEEREQKKRMWNEGMRIYFPDGTESKDYCLSKFVPEMLRAVTVDEIHRYEIKTIVLLKK